VHHGVEPGELVDGDVAQVDGQPRHVRYVEVAEDARGEQPAVQAGDVVARGRQDRGHHGAQVALVAGQQNAHESLLELVVGIEAG
jgi:hypothetical protein